MKLNRISNGFSSFLWGVGSIFAGIGSIFGLKNRYPRFGSWHGYNFNVPKPDQFLEDDVPEIKNDDKAIRSDWEAIGQDMWKAVKRANKCL